MFNIMISKHMQNLKIRAIISLTLMFLVLVMEKTKGWCQCYSSMHGMVDNCSVYTHLLLHDCGEGILVVSWSSLQCTFHVDYVK